MRHRGMVNMIKKVVIVINADSCGILSFELARLMRHAQLAGGLLAKVDSNQEAPL